MILPNSVFYSHLFQLQCKRFKVEISFLKGQVQQRHIVKRKKNFCLLTDVALKGSFDYKTNPRSSTLVTIRVLLDLPDPQDLLAHLVLAWTSSLSPSRRRAPTP